MRLRFVYYKLTGMSKRVIYLQYHNGTNIKNISKQAPANMNAYITIIRIQIHTYQRDGTLRLHLKP